MSNKSLRNYTTRVRFVVTHFFFFFFFYFSDFNIDPKLPDFFVLFCRQGVSVPIAIRAKITWVTSPTAKMFKNNHMKGIYNIVIEVWALKTKTKVARWTSRSLLTTPAIGGQHKTLSQKKTSKTLLKPKCYVEYDRWYMANISVFGS